MKRQSFSMQKSSFLPFLLFAVSTSKCNAGWVDPDTPEEFLSTTAHFEKDTREYELVSCTLFVSYIHVSLRPFVELDLMQNCGSFSTFHLLKK